MPNRHSRILYYSHDTFGLGHIRRTLAIADQVARDVSGARQLLITGSMVAGAFALPPHLDLIKLPALSKHSDGRYKARALPLSLAQTMAWREQMILQAVQAFQPDVLLVDKTPAGVEGELLPTLRHLKTWMPHTHLVLGMRDIEDDPASTCAEWDATGARKLHTDVYDRILLYGLREVFDPVREYQMPPAAAAKIIPTGYLGRRIATRPPQVIRRELDAGNRALIVVTAGGGGDGFELIKSYLDARATNATLRDAHSLIVTGPLMARGKRELLKNAGRAENLSVIEFTPDLLSYLSAADLVVSMAGYNTVCETLSLGARLLLVPRVKPRLEQRIRAEALAARGLAHMILPDDLAPQNFARAIETALRAPAPQITLDLKGLERVSHALGKMLLRA
ncbi:MAG: glycosyltransferase [Chloroflexi bacterium]|nr:glycosyltransferase [Chloroflexota bacterium]